VSADGRILVRQVRICGGIRGRGPQAGREVDLSWHDFSSVVAISRDGSQILFTESGEAGGARYATYLRGTDGSPAIRLGEGRGLDLSADGRWALTMPLDGPARLVVLSIGAGQPVTLEAPGFARLRAASFLPDSQRVLVHGDDPNGAPRSALLSIQGGEARVLTDPVVDLMTRLVTPDGRWVVGRLPGAEPRPALVSLEGEPPRLLDTTPSGKALLEAVGRSASVLGWDTRGQALHVLRLSEPSFPIDAVDRDTARSRRLLELRPPGRETDAVPSDPVVVSPDGTAYAYSYKEMAADLYVVTGVE